MDQGAFMSVSVIEIILALIETLLEIGIFRPADFMAMNLFEQLERSLTIMKNQQVQMRLQRVAGIIIMLLGQNIPTAESDQDSLASKCLSLFKM